MSTHAALFALHKSDREFAGDGNRFRWTQQRTLQHNKPWLGLAAIVSDDRVVMTA
jgi:hypothetical protein